MKRLAIFLLMLAGLSGQAASLADKQAASLADKQAASLADQARVAAVGELPKGARVELAHFFVRGEAPAAAEVSVVSPHPSLGLVQFRVSWWDGGEEHHQFATGVVRAYLPVAVTRFPIRHGEMFSDENVEFQTRELSPIAASGYFHEAAVLHSLRANGGLRAGQVVGLMSTQRSLAVVAGQTVELLHERGALRMSMKARALQGGAVDSIVRVENPGTHKVLTARVSAPGEVRVE